ncbi:MAG: hypothetical protein ACYTEQ_20975 [Planctomycetota bacterium]
MKAKPKERIASVLRHCADIFWRSHLPEKIHGAKKAKAKAPNHGRPPGTEGNGEGAITGQALVRLAKVRFGTSEATDEQSFKDTAKGRPTAVAKDCTGRFEDGGCSPKIRKNRTGSTVVRGPPCRAGTGDGLAGLRENKNRGPPKQAP